MFHFFCLSVKASTDWSSSTLQLGPEETTVGQKQLVCVCVCVGVSRGGHIQIQRGPWAFPLLAEINTHQTGCELAHQAQKREALRRHRQKYSIIFLTK